MPTITAFDKRQRNASTYTSGSVAVPPGTRELIITAQMDLSDRRDATLRLRGAIEMSFDITAATWEPLVSCVWQGGAIDPRTGLPDDTPPSCGVSVPTGALWLRGTLDISARLNI